MNERVEWALRAARASAAPLSAYVYDLQVVCDRARRVRDALPETADLFYAVKANAHPEVVRVLAGGVDGFEVGSAGEAALVHETLGRAVPLSFSGPAKTDADLAAVLRMGSAQINVESAHELRRVNLAAQEVGTLAPVTLRVNRSGAALPGSHQMTGTPSQFGIDEQDLPAALALLAELPNVRCQGVHLHAVSNNTDAAAHAAFVADSVAWAADLADRGALPLTVIDVGGGIGVDYGVGADGFDTFDLELFGAAVRGLVVPDGVRLMFELGRYIVAPAGWYAAEVIDVKRSQGRAFALLRGGMHHFRLPSAWRMNQPFTVLPIDDWDYPWPRTAVYDEPVDLAGELCTPRDVFARDAYVERLRIGDVVAFELAGGYGWEISHHDFLQHPHPRHLILDPVGATLTPLV